MKLTTEQIQAVNKALLRARIAHYDIRLELTDHVASVLEKQEGDFEQNLAAYINDNKKLLRRLNYKFMRTGATKGLKLLFTNLFSWRILLIFVGIIGLGKVIQQFAAPDDMGIFMFLIFVVCSVMGTYPAIENIFRKRESFSFDLGIAFVPTIVLYPSILMQRWVPNPDFLIVYYAFVGAFSVNIHFTIKELYKKYLSLYHV
ncbi:hypothetical protein ACLI08_03840 [Flavobacterium sp. RNTU_13]|uniref:hypothetical protein n=1 Tax=Flavobacterium sp. RNTU_13 TaxID=3375145 RepID=UPI003985D59A